MANKTQLLKNISNRQKIIIALVGVVGAILAWQVYALFGSGGGDIAPPPAPMHNTMAASPPGAMPQAPSANAPAMAQGMPPAPPPVAMPKPTNVPETQALSPREMELTRMLQDMQDRYLQAVNELQLLKVSKDIAETNKDISAAKLATVVAQKQIVDILAPPPPPPSTLTANLPSISIASGEGQYAVVSISQLQYRWSAILGYKGTLYNVHVGDVLPMDGSKVVSIANTSVVLEKGGNRMKLTLVPRI